MSPLRILNNSESIGLTDLIHLPDVFTLTLTGEHKNLFGKKSNVIFRASVQIPVLSYVVENFWKFDNAQLFEILSQ